jgi:hypothetical protein
MATIAEEDGSPGLDVSDLESKGEVALPKIKTLGVQWNATKDLFTFEFKVPKEDFWTKRKVLAAFFYDPLGFVLPYIISSRIIFQNMWFTETGWDDPIAPHTKAAWDAWLKSLSDLPLIEIKRCLRNETDEKTVEQYVVIFTDASDLAYGTVAYMFTRYENGNTSSNLISSKARVAPIKALGIPKMELLASVLGISLSLEEIGEDNIFY